MEFKPNAQWGKGVFAMIGAGTPLDRNELLHLLI